MDSQAGSELDLGAQAVGTRLTPALLEEAALLEQQGPSKPAC